MKSWQVRNDIQSHMEIIDQLGVDVEIMYNASRNGASTYLRVWMLTGWVRAEVGDWIVQDNEELEVWTDEAYQKRYGGTNENSEV